MTRPDWLKDGSTFWRRNPTLALMAEDACAEAIEDLRQAAVDAALAKWIEANRDSMEARNWQELQREPLLLRRATR
jgi:predicted component of type VI protein secretion system